MPIETPFPIVEADDEISNTPRLLRFEGKEPAAQSEPTTVPA